VLLVVVVVEILAVGSLAVSLGSIADSLPRLSLWSTAILLACGALSTEASLGVERLRRRTDESPHIDLISVWAIAAAILLPGLIAGALVAALYAHLYLRVSRPFGVPPHRFLFSVATVVLAVQAASVVIQWLAVGFPFRGGPGLLAVGLALITYAVVNMSLIAGVIVLSGPTRNIATFLQVLSRGDDVVHEFATLCVGVLVAGAVASFGAPYALLVLPPLIVLHRTVLVRQFEEAASTDSKTGLLNAATWHVLADQEMRRAVRGQARLTVLVLDLDHFKLINDRYGHLVGDQVLAEVAAAVRAEVRDEDIVGRFGGEEFVVLLRGSVGRQGGPREAAEVVAERIRRGVAGLRVAVPGSRGALVVEGLTVSIGGATLPHDGVELGELLRVADAAMYEAKQAGRNRIRMGSGGPGVHD
jgi:diguanylate cyclase (GGDEF)-like protein